VSGVRPDHAAIAARVPEGAKVLDVGCGDGTLLSLLKTERQADARGLEVSSAGVEQCLMRGLSVIQGDAENDLEIFPDNGFDVAILSKAIQEMRRPAVILQELSRIAPDIVISFRNYGHWRRRIGFLLSGRMPQPRQERWHDAEALHPSTAADMLDLSEESGLSLVAVAPVSGERVGVFRPDTLGLVNLTAEDAVFHLRRA